MPRDVIVPQTPATGSGYPTIPLTVLTADVTFTAGDPVDGDSFVHTGRELIIVRNVHVTDPFNLTVKASANRFRRTGTDIVYAIAAGVTSTFGPFPLEGWRQVDGKMWIDVEDASLEIGVLRLPSMP